MSEKAISIGAYVISSRVITVLGTVPQVLGSSAVAGLLTQGANDVVGAAFAVEVDPYRAAQLMIDRIDAKRQALGI
jgi:carbon-monoxide dehydrogenase catalytic subunit